MKRLLTICLILSAGLVKGQTIIPATTTVDSLNKLPNATYRFFTIAKKDTVDMAKNSVPACPVCPPPPKQRTAISVTITITATNKNILITYDDGTTSTL